jgi:hypothetical protein
MRWKVQMAVERIELGPTDKPVRKHVSVLSAHVDGTRTVRGCANALQQPLQHYDDDQYNDDKHHAIAVLAQ